MFVIVIIAFANYITFKDIFEKEITYQSSLREFLRKINALDKLPEQKQPLKHGPFILIQIFYGMVIPFSFTYAAGFNKKIINALGKFKACRTRPEEIII